MSATTAALNVDAVSADANGCNQDNKAMLNCNPKPPPQEDPATGLNINFGTKAEGDPSLEAMGKKEATATENINKENPTDNIDNQENIGNGTHTADKREFRENGSGPPPSCAVEGKVGAEKSVVEKKVKGESENNDPNDHNVEDKASGEKSPRSVPEKDVGSRSRSTSEKKCSTSDGGSGRGRKTSRSDGSRSRSLSKSISQSISRSRRNSSMSHRGRRKRSRTRSRSRSRRRYSLSSSRSRSRGRSRSVRRRLRRSPSYSQSRSMSRRRYRRRPRRSRSRSRRSHSRSRRSYSRSRSRRTSRSRSHRRGRSSSDERHKGRDRRWRTKFRSRSRVRRSILNGNVEPDSQTRRLFTESLKELIRRRSLPCNISILNDIMRTRDRTFHVHKRGFPSFSLLCIAFEQEKLLSVQKTGQTWTIRSSHLEREVLSRSHRGPRRRGRSRTPRSTQSPRSCSYSRSPKRTRHRSTHSRSPFSGSPASPPSLRQRGSLDGERWEMA